MHNKQQIQRHTKGAALLLFVLFFMFASTALAYLMSKSVYTDLVSYRTLMESKTSFMLSEAALEDTLYRRIAGESVDTSETVTLFGGTAITDTVVDSANGRVSIEASADYADAVRTSAAELRVSSGASFNFGVQSGNGGFEMTNSSAVIGNVFSNGSITGQGSSLITGSVTSAGPFGVIDGVHATSSARAHSIGPTRTTLIEGDAYYQSIDLGNTTVHGSLYPGSTDIATTALPFPDEKVEAFKATITKAIADGVGTLIASTDAECSSGTYAIETDTTFSDPTKIECDLQVKKKGAGTKLTLLDNVWVAGSISFDSGPMIESNPAVATNSVLMIADNESDRITSSKITVGQGTEFYAPTSPKSYIMLVSMNDDAENGSGTEVAIDMGQSSEGDVIIYAGHGEVTLANQIELKEVTGYLISMGNQSVVRYESGLIDLNFVGGPGGGFEIGNWNEIE